MANIDSREENNNFCAIQFDYFRGMEAEQYSFYRIPKVLFTADGLMEKTGYTLFLQ